MFIDIRNLQERRAERDSQFEDTRDIRNGYLFEVNGSVEGDREGLVWFKALDGNSEPFQVFYNGIIGDLRANMFVKIERNPKTPARWQVIEFDTGIYFDDQSAYEQLPSTSMIPAKEDYEWPPGFPGAKALNIFPRAITDFAVRPTSPASMKARVYSGIYPGATNYARFQGPVNTKDFTADIPGAGLALLAAISIDNTGTLNYTNGTTFVDGLPMPDASLPAVPASEMLISAIRLVNGMTTIEESNFDLEMRPLMANGTVNVKVSKIWESDFGNVALQADATGQIEVGKVSGPDAKFEIVDTAGAQLRLTHTDASKFADFVLDTNHDLTITPSSTGQIILQPTTDSIDFFQVLDANGGTPVFNVDSTNESISVGTVATTFVVTGSTNNANLFIESPDQARFFGFALSKQSNSRSSAFTVLRARAGATAVVDTDVIGAMQFMGHDGTDYNRSAAMQAQIDGAVSSNVMPGKLVFQTAVTNLLVTRMVIDSAGLVGINVAAPLAQLHVNQASTTAAIPTLYLDQADISEEMIEFNTTIGTGNAIEAVGAKVLTTTHFIKVTLPGALTRYFPVGTIA